MAFPLSSEFRQIAYSHGGRPNADGLFRAAVAAFSSLTRPTRREVIQLDDLAEPLYPALSVEAKRFAAAALSDSRYAPAELIRRLGAEAVDVGAPLLIRSPVLTDVDLIAFIGRHGAPHARAIRRRPDLNPAIARLADALLDKAPKGGVEAALDRLRGMMHPAQPAAPEGPASGSVPQGRDPAYARLLGTAFHPNGALFETALADALDIAFERAQRIVHGPHHSELMLAFRALDLGEEQAFLLTAATCPGAFVDRSAVQLFIERYRRTGSELAAEKLASWRERRSSQANASAPRDAPARARLKAS